VELSIEKRKCLLSKNDLIHPHARVLLCLVHILLTLRKKVDETEKNEGFLEEWSGVQGCRYVVWR